MLPRKRKVINSIYLKDSFTGADGTSLSSHTPEIGGPWALTGGWQIQSNQAKSVSLAGGHSFAFATAPGAAHCTVQGDISSAMSNGLIANVTDVDHLFMAWDDGGTIILYEEVGHESFVSRGSAAVSTGLITAQLIPAGDAISIKVGGVTVVTYSTAGRANQSATTVGMMTFGATGLQIFDNILVTP